MDAQYNLEVFETPEKLCEATCNFIIDLSKKSIAAKGRFVISLSGGNTPLQLFRMLAQPSYSSQIDWTKTFIFWGDERCVPLTDERNNSYQAKVALLDKVKVPTSNVFPIPVDLPPAEAANKYESSLKYFFKERSPKFDLILLGLGENGHTASLFPGTDVIHEQTRWVKEVYVDEQKMFRVTITAPLINLADNIVFLVTGFSKAEILQTVLNGPYQPDTYPAQLIKPETGKLYWFTDKDAARKIPAS